MRTLETLVNLNSSIRSQLYINVMVLLTTISVSVITQVFPRLYQKDRVSSHIRTLGACSISFNAQLSDMPCKVAEQYDGV